MSLALPPFEFLVFVFMELAVKAIYSDHIALSLGRNVQDTVDVNDEADIDLGNAMWCWRDARYLILTKFVFSFGIVISSFEYRDVGRKVFTLRWEGSAASLW